MVVRIGIFVAALVLAGLAYLAISHVYRGEPQSGFLAWQDSATIARGGDLYRQNCAACHGIPGASSMPPLADAPPQDERGHSWEHPDYALFHLVRDGKAVANCTPVDPDKMPRFADTLDDEAIIAVLSYIKSTWPAETRRYQHAVNEIYAENNHALATELSQQ